MHLKFIYPRWGSSSIPWPVFLNKIKEAGYHGVEIDLPLDKSEKNEICCLLKDMELDMAAHIPMRYMLPTPKYPLGTNGK